ncbi:hypothetical protein WME90_33010 [Sorangium sp. So ce375]|uniref:hypothetical protein n=1 Tax=Sorangium sp. So ce375 TaxID=3133306 RepID=UPI003F5B4DA4
MITIDIPTPAHRPVMLTGELDMVPVGFAMENVKSGPEGGQSVKILPRGFYTSDDGPELYTYLDQLFVALLGRTVLSRGVRIEDIDNCLVNVVYGTHVKVWINFPTKLTFVAKGELANGHPVALDDIADVREAHFPGIELPDCGSIAYTFQHGWRRGFYFDFVDYLGEGPEEARHNLPKLFGSLHTALLLRERIRMSADVLDKMSRAGWFPFVRLPHEIAMDLYRHFEIGWDYSSIEAQIVRVLSGNIQNWIKEWANKPVFAPHMEAIRAAAQAYATGQYMAASILLLPKVEGVLRHLHVGKGQATARSLRTNLFERVRADVEGFTAYLPEAFVRYLETFYYAAFDLESNVLPPSRHAFAHGVGPDAQAAEPIFCLRLLLTLDQLFFYV